MEARLVQFARLLRQNGVRVTPGEVAEAGRAVALVGVGERADVRAALRATLLKRAADVPLFEELFDVWFSGFGRALDGLGRGLLAELGAGGARGEGEQRAAALALQELLGSLSPLARAALTGERGALARAFDAASRRVDFAALIDPAQIGFYGRRLLGAAGGGAAARELAEASQALRRRGLSPRALDLATGALRAALDALDAAARRYAALEQRARAAGRRRRAPGLREGAALSGLPAAPSPAELERMESAVRRLAERLRARLVARARAGRGSLHVRRTLRRNLGVGGIPVRLAFRRRRTERPDVVVLCDVSDSVRHASRLMLLFLHVLHGAFTRVRSFVFVAELAEVTEAFREERDLARAAERATAEAAIGLQGNSSYGRALRAFHDRFRSAVSRRTTVIVIGDGRNNYHPPEAWVLDELRRRARRVVWICPEGRWSWGQGDSEMPLYASKVERVAVVTSLADMEGVADALLPPRAARH